MSYLMITKDEYILGVCECDSCANSISKNEFQRLSILLRNRPKSSNEGEEYLLNEKTLEWEGVLRSTIETDIPIEGETGDDTEQKAAAFDYLTGRAESE